MNKRFGIGAVALAWLALLGASCSSAPSTTSTKASGLTALDRYVAQPDPTYSWKVVTSIKGEGGTGHLIDLTSQTWLTTNEVNRTVWRHWLLVVTPDKIEHSTALLFIGGGKNGDAKMPGANRDLIEIAKATKSVVAELKMVPNQPLIFDGDGKERVEDDLIAYTWDKFLRTGDDRWPAREPMTKSAVRAMDTITAFCASEPGGKAKVDTFVVAGGSKRGWTTWTTAAVDKRVVAICPIVIDVLNMEASMLHHYQAYGFWAPAVGNYTEQGIMNWMGTPEMKALLRVEEPYSYRDRLTMPKLLLNSSGDQFFLPDSSQFYFKDLPGVKYLRYVPNSDHGLKGTDAYETLLAWHDATLHHTPLPRFTWSHENNGTLRVETLDRPRAARLWQAHNPIARDFRLETLGPVWTATELSDQGHGVFVAKVEKPGQGWTAYFVELTYDLGARTPLKLTTDVRVTPDTLPHSLPVPARPAGFLSH